MLDINNISETEYAEENKYILYQNIEQGRFFYYKAIVIIVVYLIYLAHTFYSLFY